MLNRKSLKKRKGKCVLIGDMQYVTHYKILSCLRKIFDPYSLKKYNKEYKIFDIPLTGIRFEIFRIPIQNLMECYGKQKTFKR